MIRILYIEDEVAHHPVTQALCRRFAHAVQIPIGRYTEVFNRNAQNFRLQKRQPGLILARKFDAFVLEAPLGYGIGAGRNFYFSHMLNCLYDCRYCFLQGMYRSAHYVLFVNYEDFQAAIEAKLQEIPQTDTFFFSGYDCDSLALEPVSGFVERIIPFFARHPYAWLELRTKSTQIRTLLQQQPLPNVVVAFSFTPDEIAKALEHKVPQVVRRIEAMQRLAHHGWMLGLRFDPLIYAVDYRTYYATLFAAIFSRIQTERLHSVSLGPFRLPRPFYRTMRRLYPDEPLFAGQLDERNGVVSYPAAIEQQMRTFCIEELLRYIPKRLLFACEF